MITSRMDFLHPSHFNARAIHIIMWNEDWNTRVKRYQIWTHATERINVVTCTCIKGVTLWGQKTLLYISQLSDKIATCEFHVKFTWNCSWKFHINFTLNSFRVKLTSGDFAYTYIHVVFQRVYACSRAWKLLVYLC